MNLKPDFFCKSVIVIHAICAAAFHHQTFINRLSQPSFQAALKPKQLQFKGPEHHLLIHEISNNIYPATGTLDAHQHTPFPKTTSGNALLQTGLQSSLRKEIPSLQSPSI